MIVLKEVSPGKKWVAYKDSEVVGFVRKLASSPEYLVHKKGGGQDLPLKAFLTLSSCSLYLGEGE